MGLATQVPVPFLHGARRIGRVPVAESNLKNMLKKFILVIVAISLSGCATVYNPVTGVEEVALVDTQTEVSMGQRMAWQVARGFPLNRNPGLNRRVMETGNNIARVSDRQDLVYYFTVIRGKDINAFTLPGGFIYVFSGLVEAVDDDELAIVLAHEVGHVAARHPAKKMEVEMGYQLLDSLIFGRSSGAEMRQVMNIFFNVVASGYERGDELWADRLSLRYAKRAGYDPSAAIRFMRKLQEYEGRRGAPAYTILSSHPPLEDRMINVENELTKLSEEGYEKKGPVEKKDPLQEKKPVSPANPLIKSSPYIKICPTCHREYPLNFNYCARDGSKLE